MPLGSLFSDIDAALETSVRTRQYSSEVQACGKWLKMHVELREQK